MYKKKKKRNHLEAFLKYQLLGPKAHHLLPSVSESVDLGVKVGADVCIPNKFPGDVDTAGQGTTLEESLIKINQQLIGKRGKPFVVGN